jgi:hypothetical protein
MTAQRIAPQHLLHLQRQAGRGQQGVEGGPERARRNWRNALKDGLSSGGRERFRGV